MRDAALREKTPRDLGHHQEAGRRHGIAFVETEGGDGAIAWNGSRRTLDEQWEAKWEG